MQQSFLSETAQKLYTRYGNDISSLTIVFPSRRARLFFTEALSLAADKPLWQPHYMSMDDIMREASAYVAGDKVRIMTELYKVYSSYHDETFDKFYFWGEMLLGDFDLIDKYLIDADMLFRNICDLKELEADLSYLTPEMRKIINTFWQHFQDQASLSDEKRRFLSIWLSLSAVYHGLRKRLDENGFAYAGMMYRSAVEKIKNGTGGPDTSRNYVFVGFNALSACEKEVLKYLTINSRCEFFWDYDTYYTENSAQEAGRFLREDLRAFPATDDTTHDNFLNIEKSIQAVSTVSNAVQCKYTATLLRQISPDLKFDKQTAIVLTDESLLMPLLHSLPKELEGNINVTMGYPLRQTTTYSFIERLFELQKNSRKNDDGVTFYHTDVMGLLRHPYITEIASSHAEALRRTIIDNRYIRVPQALFADDDTLATIFASTDSWETLSKYIIDVINAIAETTDDNDEYSIKLSYLSIIAEHLNQLNNSLQQCDIHITTSIYTSLVKKHLQTVRIPFSGEPLHGLQVMGILETRNLDFRNVIILSMNDDNFPGKMTGDTSFIPYNLRAAYGLPTPEHHEGVYAYYFYRLIQRAERVDMLYCSHADEKTTGEQSRYIYQLQYESQYNISRTNVGVDLHVEPAADIRVPKIGTTLDALMKYLDPESKTQLSPTALSRYIVCPLKFYFASIARLKPADELTDDVDSPMFGNILHAAMERLYRPLIGIVNPAQQLERLLNGDTIENAVTESINEKYLNRTGNKDSDYTGNIILVRNVVVKYIKHGIIPYDIKHPSFTVMNVEQSISHPLALSDGRNLKIGGTADRIDSLDNGCQRIVDYKTGAKHLEFNNIDTLFSGNKRQDMSNILQTLIYSMIVNHNSGRNVLPALYFARLIHNDTYSPYIADKSADKRADNSSDAVNYADYAEVFETLLRQKMDELFNPDIDFTQCDASEAKDTCKYCDFKLICKRHDNES